MPVNYDASAILDSLSDSIDYSTGQRSMSPFFSDIGLGFGPNGGIASVYLHYNRRVNSLGNPFLAVVPTPLKRVQTVAEVVQQFDTGSARFCFYQRNSWLVELHHQPFSFRLPESAGPAKPWLQAASEAGNILLRFSVPNRDPRDPDDTVPVVIGLRVIRGSRGTGGGLCEPFTVECDASGTILVAMTVAILDIDSQAIESILRQAPDNTDIARSLTHGWFIETLGNIRFVANDSGEGSILSRAAYTLVSNATMAPGLLAGRISAFPSRGHYPTHYLWDSCFENLALEHMAPTLASDALLLLTENLRSDGKMAHFICSTWARPKASQPPLVGWAGLRIVKARDDRELARQLLYPLVKNTNWWLTQRATRYGLIYCADPLETGWDNTPRLDKGPVLACDMNSYLLMQMRACAEMASMIGDQDTALQQGRMADEFAVRMVSVLYDKRDNIFRELLLESGELLSIKTPACFLPLLAGVPLERAKIDAMIRERLLNPAEFFGDIPFPSVAYNDPAYNAGNWWRGPTWMPIAYFMLQILKSFGFEEPYRTAAMKLYAMIISDGEISELFNSETGAGKGSKQQGWTAAILLQLNNELFCEQEALL